MDLLSAEGYRVVDVVEAARLLATGDGLERVAALSFDDGYRDVAEHALGGAGAARVQRHRVRRDGRD